MTREELILRIKKLAPQVVASRQQAELAAVEYDELTKFPELKQIIIDLLTDDFDKFLTSIDWVAPRPTTFRISLKNGQEFLFECSFQALKPKNLPIKTNFYHQ